MLTTRSPDGAELRLSPHGGQVLDWVPARGSERLWTSPVAAPPVLRGGVPVVFPQFSDRGPLPKHGFARDRRWQVQACDGGRAMLTLSDSPATRALWPHEFSLALTAEVRADRIEIDLTVTNTGPGRFSFTAALHAYLAVDHAPAVVVDGLGDHDGQDQAAGLAPVRVPPGPLAVRPPVDLAVLGASRARRIRGGASRGDLWLTTGGFTDTVLWNPGQQPPDDLPLAQVNRFVCLEPAVLTPHRLEPGDTWRGALRLSADVEAGPQDPNGVQPALPPGVPDRRRPGGVPA